MPQLNPSPWFLILTASWLIYLTFFIKIYSLKMTSEPLTKDIKYLPKPWSWPWI